MKRIICTLVVLGSVLSKEAEEIQLERSPLADYLLSLARFGKTVSSLVEGFQMYHPQNLFRSIFTGQPLEAKNTWEDSVDEKSIHHDEFLQDYFTEDEKHFIKKTIFKANSSEGSMKKKVLPVQGLEKQYSDQRLLQETTFDQLPTISKSLEDEYKNEQQDILNRLTATRFRFQVNVSLGANKTCYPGMPLVNHSMSVYACRGVRLSEEEYTNRTNKTGCYINNASIEACYCSFDYYGRYCNKFVGLSCQGERSVDYDPQCLQEHYEKFGTKRMGYPPCRPFTNGLYEFEAQYSCSLYNVSKSLKSIDFMREGVKLEYLMIPDLKLKHKNFTNNSNITFQYAMQNPEVAGLY